MITDMSTARITEEKLSRDLHTILVRIQQGLEVVVEENHLPVAVLRPANSSAWDRLGFLQF